MKRSLCLFFLLTLPASATISYVRSSTNWTGTTSTSCNVSLGTTGAGDLLAVWAEWQTSSGPNTVTITTTQDNRGLRLLLSAVGPTVQSQSNTAGQIFYIASVPSGGDGVNLSFSGSVASSACVIVEYSGADQYNPFDSASAAYSNSSFPSNFLDSGNVAPASSSLLLFGGGVSDAGSGGIIAGSGFTNLASSAVGTGGTGSAIVEYNSSAITTNNVLQRATACLGPIGGLTCNSNTGNWLMQIAVFRAATSGVVPTVQRGWSPARESILHADQFPSIQAAINALPALGGTVFVPNGTPFDTAGLTITTPLHLVFDQGTFTYQGTTSPAISCTGVDGVIIEGSGHDTPGSIGTEIAVTSGAVDGIKAVGCGAITLRDFNIVGPGSGTGKGIVISSTRSKTENVAVESFGGDGFTIDGSVANSSLYEVDHVHSALNGGSGFVSLDCNGQVGTFLNDDAQTNGGDGFKIGNGGNTFISTNTNSNASGIGYHFVTGNPCPPFGNSVANYNTGSVFSDAPNSPELMGLQFDMGTVSNSFFVIGNNAPILFKLGANANTITSQLPHVTDLGAGNRWQQSSQVWDAFNTYILQIGQAPGNGGGVIRLFNSTGGTTTLLAPPGVNLNSINLYTPNPTVDSTLLASPGSGSITLNQGPLTTAGCEPTISVAMSGVTASSHIVWNFANDPSAVAGYGGAPAGAVQVYAWPTTGNVNFIQCSAVAVTPGSISVNWEVH